MSLVFMIAVGAKPGRYQPCLPNGYEIRCDDAFHRPASTEQSAPIAAVDGRTIMPAADHDWAKPAAMPLPKDG
jgi:hypothetical protein